MATRSTRTIQKVHYELSVEDLEKIIRAAMFPNANPSDVAVTFETSSGGMLRCAYAELTIHMAPVEQEIDI